MGERGGYGANIVVWGDIWVSAATGDTIVAVERKEKKTIWGINLVVSCNSYKKLDRVGLVDNRPSTD